MRASIVMPVGSSSDNIEMPKKSALASSKKRREPGRHISFAPFPTFFSISEKGSSSTTTVSACSSKTKVTAQELDTILDGVRICPIVVDFYATWCGPCILLSQELDKLAAEYGEMVKFLKVDTDEEHELASELKIQGLPTLVFVSKDSGKNAIRTEGLLAADVIRNIIENEL
ncbi:hypothetical protein L7F22_024092 [Adiantum nelumboides]|nr:hypothetical protein [Adiantum nelumboides]